MSFLKHQFCSKLAWLIVIKNKFYFAYIERFWVYSICYFSQVTADDDSMGFDSGTDIELMRDQYMLYKSSTDYIPSEEDSSDESDTDLLPPKLKRRLIPRVLKI